MLSLLKKLVHFFYLAQQIYKTTIFIPIIFIPIIRNKKKFSSLHITTGKLLAEE